MKRARELQNYAWIGGAILLLDRITKWIVLHYLENEYICTSFLSFDLVVNRGISWGMFHSTNQAMFMLVTTLVMGVIVFLISHAYTRWSDSFAIYGEIMVLAGALSNLFDRFMYRGVIDFIEVTTGKYVWPSFNVADIAIFFGVMLMLISVYSDRETKK
ncbi:signal peptidase II [Candidatus Babeliales bacterium]|nr:signal peptidase II [Candidatus Babeliales bacterium]